jgi:hypothetical protein
MKCKYILTITALALLTGSSFATTKPPMSTPTISCYSSTGSSITIQVTGGSPTGAPAGITVQWISLADFQANGNAWPSDSSLYCAASLSGVPGCSSYNLAAGGSVTVQIGDNLFDLCGESSNCASIPLQCGTTYVFRAFAHANSTYNRSAFTPNLQCSTLPCSGGGGCTYTQGYWKNHGGGDCLNGDPNATDQWPASVQANGLTLGTVTYTEAQLCSILNLSEATPGAPSNGLVGLAHQLIAAELNIANGADASTIQSTIDAANTSIGGLIIPPVGNGSLTPNQVSSLQTALDNYNNGLTGPGHCP